jgi:hypothetical protein
LTRTKGMLGDWKRNKYSANNLSRHILWWTLPIIYNDLINKII